MVYTAPYSKPNAATVESSPVLAGSMIVFGASDGYLYAVDADNGRIITKINLGAPVLGSCLLYTSDAADDLLCVDLGGRRFIKKKKLTDTWYYLYPPSLAIPTSLTRTLYLSHL